MKTPRLRPSVGECSPCNFRLSIVSVLLLGAVGWGGSGCKSIRPCASPKAPRVLQQPCDTQSAVGESASFSVRASRDVLNYQWYRNTGGGDSPIVDEPGRVTGSDTAKLRLENLRPEDFVLYSCQVSTGQDALGSLHAALWRKAELPQQPPLQPLLLTTSAVPVLTVYGIPQLGSGTTGPCNNRSAFTYKARWLYKPATLWGYRGSGASNGWACAPNGGDYVVQWLPSTGVIRGENCSGVGNDCATIPLSQYSASTRFRFLVYYIGSGTPPSSSPPLSLFEFVE